MKCHSQEVIRYCSAQVELQAMLSAMGMPKSGKKVDLAQRLIDAELPPVAEGHPPSPPPPLHLAGFNIPAKA